MLIEKYIDIFVGKTVFISMEKGKKEVINEHTGKSMLTEAINGIKYGVLECTIEEYAKQVGAVNIDDIQWTN